MRIMSNTFELINKFKKPFIFASSQMSEMGYSSYGMLKALGEKITKVLGGLVVRFWNVYGYETDDTMPSLIEATDQELENMALEGTEIEGCVSCSL